MKDDQFHSFLWIELKESTSAEDWVSLIERCGLKSLCIIKLFAHAPMYSINVRRAIQVQQLTWERGQLRDMLVKRIKQTRQLSVDDFPLDKILDEAKGSPARLIGAGNKFGFPGE